MMLFWSLTIRVTAILLIALVGIRLSRSRSSAFRHWILTAAIFSAAAMTALSWVNRSTFDFQLEIPIATRAAPLQTKPVAQPPALGSTESRPIGSQAESNSLSNGSRVDPSVTAPIRAVREVFEIVRSETAPLGGPTIPALIIYLWLAGILLVLLRLISGILQMRGITSNSLPMKEMRWVHTAEQIAASYELRRRVDLRECRDTAVLATWGFLRPKLLLPSGAEDWPDGRILAVLYHELAHIRRNDWIIQMVAEVLRAIWWFNPLGWIVCRRLVLESELACDDMALKRDISGSNYAEQLLALARSSGRNRMWSEALFMARHSTLERRFAAMLDPKANRSIVTRSRAWSVVAAFLAVTLTLMTVKVTAKTAKAIAATVPFQNTLQKALGSSSSSPIESALLSLASQAEATSGGSSVLRGIVVRLGTNEPIPGASIELRKIECGEAGLPPEVYTALTGLPNPYWTTPASAITPPEVFTALTGNDGKFSFPKLSAGSYCMVAYRAAAGYLAAEYQQRGYRGRGVTLTIANGQQMQDIRLALPPTGSISGRVLDNHGEPVAHAQVQALEPYFQDGERRLNVAMSMQTNDLGEYRLYWLPPGRYYMAATLEDPQRRTIHFADNPTGRGGRLEVMTYPVISYRELEDGSVQEEASTYMYYGGGNDPQRAAAIDVSPGADIGGMDIAFGSGRVRAWSVRGTVINGVTGQPAANASVRLIPPRWLSNPVIPSANSDANGVFNISGVAPGTYTLWATGRSAAARGGARATFDAIPVPELIARAPINVNSDDIRNVSIVMNAGYTITGNVIIEGRNVSESGNELKSIRVRPLRDPDILGQPAALFQDPTPSKEDGSFTLNGIGPGDYRVYVEPLMLPARLLPPPPPPTALQGMYVKSIQLGSADLLGQGLHINGTPEGQMKVVLAKGEQISGHVYNSRQQPMVNVTVVLIPDAPLRQRGDRYKTARTDMSGRFTMQGIAPGSYKLFAWEEIEEGIWMNADFIRTDETRGKAVRIVEGRTENVDAVVIPR